MPVFPTPVGVFLLQMPEPTMSESLPHARGGVSRTACAVPQLTASSPRPWGCFLIHLREQAGVDVFPTPVGHTRGKVSSL